MNKPADILIAEDDHSLLEVLKYNLTKEGYNVLSATDGVQALALARSAGPNLIILDVMLPRINGFEVCRILRQESATPILMLTAKSDEVDKVVGLEIGADDYMTKPFNICELLARLKTVLRRATTTTQSLMKGEASLELANLKIDTGQHRVMLDGKVLTLAPREFEMLLYLVHNKGLVLSRKQILNKVWGYDYPGGIRTVDVHVRWLRQKIEKDPSNPERVLTIRGIGYKMEG